MEEKGGGGRESKSPYLGGEDGSRRKNKQMSPLAGTEASGTAFHTYFCRTLMEKYRAGCGICR